MTVKETAKISGPPPSYHSHMSPEAHELLIHGDNEASLHRDSYVPTIRSLHKRVKNGTYDHAKAEKAWEHHADKVADSYAKHYGSPGQKGHHIFSKAHRREAAKEWGKNVHEDLKNGNYDDAFKEKAAGHTDHKANDLVMYADNTGHLYRKSFKPTVKKLLHHIKNGTYDHEKAKKAWRAHADKAADAYVREFVTRGGNSHHVFNESHRDAAAKMWADREHHIMKSGEHDWIANEEKSNLDYLASFFEEELAGHGAFRWNFYGTNNEAGNDGKKYKVQRHHAHGPRRTVAKNCSLSEAQSHCAHPDTSSKTATSPHAQAYTRRHGEWFDGYNSQ